MQRGLQITPPSCSELELFDVKFNEVYCYNDGCGAFLSTKNRLENCTVTGTIRNTRHLSKALFVAPAGSRTIVEGLTATDNTFSIFRIEDGFISMSDSSFNDNKFACLVLNASSVEMDNCRFMHNHLIYSGTIIEATNSSVSLSRSIFHSNFADEGACIHAEGSILKLSSIEATDNRAYHRGGFIFAVNSTLELFSTKAYNNTAKKAGGFAFANGSMLSFVKTRAVHNQVPYFLHNQYTRMEPLLISRTRHMK